MTRLSLAVALLVLPALVLAQALPFDPSVLPGGGYIVTGLAVLAAAQFAARALAAVGPAVNGQTSGRGSGWYRFWNRIATFPGRSQ